MQLQLLQDIDFNQFQFKCNQITHAVTNIQLNMIGSMDRKDLVYIHCIEYPWNGTQRNDTVIFEIPPCLAEKIRELESRVFNHMKSLQYYDDPSVNFSSRISVQDGVYLLKCKLTENMGVGSVYKSEKWTHTHGVISPIGNDKKVVLKSEFAEQVKRGVPCWVVLKLGSKIWQIEPNGKFGVSFTVDRIIIFDDNINKCGKHAFSFH